MITNPVDLSVPGALEDLKRRLGLTSSVVDDAIAEAAGTSKNPPPSPSMPAIKCIDCGEELTKHQQVNGSFVCGTETPEPTKQPEAPVNNEPGTDVTAATPNTFVDPLPEAPAFLKGLRQWVLWRLEPDKEGRPTKVPYQANGYHAKSTDPGTWTDYRTAVTAAIAAGGINNTQGIGFVVNGDIVGFDLDGCRNPRTGEIAPWAGKIIEALNSYTEITPSQTGMRVWVRGNLPPGDKVFKFNPAAGFGDKVQVEVFTSGKYFTVTGDSYWTGNVETRDLAGVYQMLHDIRAEHPAPKKEKVSTGESDTSTSTSAKGVPVEREPGVFSRDKKTILMKGTIKSEKPFVIEYGRNSLPYDSQSEADMALMTCLALELGDDTDAIWEAYTESSLVRDKWLQRKEWFCDNTIAKAIKTAEKMKAEEAAKSASAESKNVPGVLEQTDWAALAGENEDRGPKYAMTSEEYEAEMNKDYPVFPLPPQGGPTWDDSIMYGPVGEMVKKAVQYSESHPAGVYLDLLVSLGNAFGRNPYFNINSTPHHTNEFLVRVGSTSKSRKGGGRDIANHIMGLVDFEWLHKRTMSGFGSGEAVINEIRDASQQNVRNRQKGAGDFKLITVPGVNDKRLCVRAGEIAGTFEVASRPGSLISVILRDGWDGNPLMNVVKGKTDGLSNSVSCKEPHLSVSADCTKEELIDKMPENSAENGFGNRFLYCYVYRTKKCPHGGPELVWAGEITHLQEVIQFAKTQRCVGLCKAAEKLWTRMYQEIEDEADIPGLAGKMVARGAAHVRRLALIFAVIDKSPVIASKHLKAAKRIWDYCLESARYIFGGVTKDQAKIVRHLEKGPMDDRTICDEVFHRHVPIAWVKSQVADLVAQGRAVRNGETITKR